MTTLIININICMVEYSSYLSNRGNCGDAYFKLVYVSNDTYDHKKINWVERKTDPFESKIESGYTKNSNTVNDMVDLSYLGRIDDNSDTVVNITHNYVNFGIYGAYVIHIGVFIMHRIDGSYVILGGIWYLRWSSWE